MRVRSILRFLLILLVSILFSVSSRFFVTSDCWSLQWGKTDWIQFTPVIVFSERDCPLVWKSVEYTVNHETYLQRRSLLKKQTNRVTRTSTSQSFKFLVETIRHHYYCMLEKSFIWWRRVWFHRMFKSRVKCF